MMVNLEMEIVLIDLAEKVALQEHKLEKATKTVTTKTAEIIKEKASLIKMVLVEISKEKVNSIKTVVKIVDKMVRMDKVLIVHKMEILKIVKDFLVEEVDLLQLQHQWKKTKRLLQRKLL